jgi:hypothetical protein
MFLNKIYLFRVILLKNLIHKAELLADRARGLIQLRIKFKKFGRLLPQVKIAPPEELHQWLCEIPEEIKLHMVHRFRQHQFAGPFTSVYRIKNKQKIVLLSSWECL